MIIIDKTFSFITKRLTMSMLSDIKNIDLNTSCYLEITRKSERYKTYRSTKWDIPLSSEDCLTAEKIVDKTGKPKEIDDKLVESTAKASMESSYNFIQ